MKVFYVSGKAFAIHTNHVQIQVDYLKKNIQNETDAFTWKKIQIFFPTNLKGQNI